MATEDAAKLSSQIGASQKPEDRDHQLAALGRLAATMAHEFNNVLMGIQPFVELISRGADHAQTEKALKHITLSIQRGKQITSEVLRISHPTETSQRSIGVAAWLLSLELDLRGILPNTVSLRIEIEDNGDPLYASVDVNQMNQVLTNLVTNAKDAMPDGGAVTITAARCYSWTTFSFALDTPDRFVRVTVADTGCGMDAATLDRAFEPMFTTKRTGTGLGLAIVKQILQRHGGTVSVESSVGGGTRFDLLLPAALPPDEDQAAPTAAQQVVCRTDLRLLIVEDDQNVASAMADSLRERGFQIDLIHTGGRALEAVRRFGSDAVILDVGLPDVSGANVFWILRSELPQLPIVFSTAHANATSLVDALAEPAVAFLNKPYSTEDLLAALAKVTAAQR